MRNTVSRLARRLIKPVLYYARHPADLFQSEQTAEAQGNMFWCRRQNMIERRILDSGVWEEGETALVKQHVTPGSVSFDVGANIGYFTLLMSALCGPDGRVHAFEPTRYAFDRMQRNRRLNPRLPDNITFNQVGLLAAPAIRRDALEARFSGAVAANTELEELRFTTIDTYCAEQKVERIDFMKIDVDGFDLQVMQGALDSIRRFKPILLVELYHRMLKQQGDALETYLELLLSLGYSDAIIAHSRERTTLRELLENRELHATSWNVLLSQ